MRLYLHFFFFNDTATTEIYTLSLHDALPIYRVVRGGRVLRYREGQHRAARGGLEGSPPDREATDRAGSAGRRAGWKGANTAGACRESVRGFLLDVPAHAGDCSGAARCGCVAERRRLSFRLRGR